MQSRKQWLLEKGHIEPSQAGRGRISADNMALVKQAYKEGVRFSDWEPKETENGTENVSPNARNSNSSGVTGEYTEIFPESDFKVFERVDGKQFPRSLREACNNCKVSLVQCTCAMVGRQPIIVATNGRGSVPVFIERK